MQKIPDVEDAKSVQGNNAKSESKYLTPCFIERSKFMSLHFPKEFEGKPSIDRTLQTVDNHKLGLKPEVSANTTVIKVWSSNQGPSQGKYKFDEVAIAKFLNDAGKSWPIDQFYFTEEYALLFLARQNYNIEKAMQYIDDRNTQFIAFCEGKDWSFYILEKSIVFDKNTSNSSGPSRSLRFKSRKR